MDNYHIFQFLRDYTPKENNYTTTYIIDEDREKEYSELLSTLGVKINDDNEI